MELHKLFLSKVGLNNSSIGLNASVGKIRKSIPLKTYGQKKTNLLQFVLI